MTKLRRYSHSKHNRPALRNRLFKLPNLRSLNCSLQTPTHQFLPTILTIINLCVFIYLTMHAVLAITQTFFLLARELIEVGQDLNLFGPAVP